MSHLEMLRPPSKPQQDKVSIHDASNIPHNFVAAPKARNRQVHQPDTTMSDDNSIFDQLSESEAAPLKEFDWIGTNFAKKYAAIINAKKAPVLDFYREQLAAFQSRVARAKAAWQAAKPAEKKFAYSVFENATTDHEATKARLEECKSNDTRLVGLTKEEKEALKKRKAAGMTVKKAVVKTIAHLKQQISKLNSESTDLDEQNPGAGPQMARDLR